jgi:hypothetical protein
VNLSKISSLWRSNFITSVRDSIIIIESGFVTLYIRFVFHLKTLGWSFLLKNRILAFLGKIF